MWITKLAASLCLAGMILMPYTLKGPNIPVSADSASPITSVIGAAGQSKLAVSLMGFPASFHMTDAKQGWGITLAGIWRTEDGAASWRHTLSNTVPIPDDAVQLGLLGHHFADDKEAWIISAYGPQQPAVVFHTTDKGASWKAARLPVKEDWERGYSKGYIYFTSERTGYYLRCSEPALGWMGKSLYRTDDGGASWSRVGELTSSVDAYPTGMTFRDAANGWITSSNHGQDYILTFRTADGGKNWNPEHLAAPPALEGYAYSNSYPPVFSGKDNMKGVLPLEIVQDGVKSMVFYTTDNGGESWKYGPELQGVEASRTAWLNARTGWALQEGGSLLTTADGGLSWRKTAKGSVLGKAEAIQFSTPRNGWITGPNMLWGTVDGGRTWSNLQP